MTIFGQDISMPVMGAPATGVNSFGEEKVITEQDFKDVSNELLV
ncbi:MAG: hypothetical protein ACFFCZ_09175 [Promethearchaeota archaeon]